MEDGHKELARRWANREVEKELERLRVNAGIAPRRWIADAMLLFVLALGVWLIFVGWGLL